MTFGVAALITWLTTAVLGGVLVLLWRLRSARSSGRRRPTYGRPPPYIPPGLVVAHVGLALTGLALWAVYIAGGEDQLTWVTLAILVPVALLGVSMFVRWLGSRRARHVARGGREFPTESRLPTAVVLGHGAVGAATLILVFLTALRLNGS